MTSASVFQLIVNRVCNSLRRRYRRGAAASYTCDEPVDSRGAGGIETSLCHLRGNSARRAIHKVLPGLFAGDVLIHSICELSCRVSINFHRSDGLRERLDRRRTALFVQGAQLGEAFLASGAGLGEHGDDTGVHLRTASVEYLRQLGRKLSCDGCHVRGKVVCRVDVMSHVVEGVFVRKLALRVDAREHVRRCVCIGL